MSLLYVESRRPLACLILAHGAGAPMDSDFMNTLAEALSDQGVSTVRFEFPFMAQRRVTGKKKPPDPQSRLLECWRSVLSQVGEDLMTASGQIPLLIGGKSMGGRMASLLVSQSGAFESEIAGICCFGYPFHLPGKPVLLADEQKKSRTAHFPSLKVPTLILQGTRDPLGKQAEIDTAEWSPVIKLHWLEDGDHDFKPRKASGLTQADLVVEAARAAGGFARSLG